MGELTDNEFRNPNTITDKRVMEINHKISTLHGEGYTALDANILAMYSYGRALQQSALKYWSKNINDIEEALALSQQICILAPNPGRIIKEVKVDLQKGDLDKLKLDSDFAKLRYELSDFLRGLQKNK